jgi:serpin B
MRIRFVAAITVFTLLGAACGSDDPGPDASGSPATTSPSTSPGPNGSTGPAPVAGVLPVSPDVERAPVAAAAPVGELVAGLNDAGFDLWRTQPATDNVVFSPASTGHALLMARGAANPATGRAIDRAFGLPAGVGAHQAWNAIDQQIGDSQSADVTVTIADRIWPALDVEPDQGWVDLLTTEHGADVQRLDLRGDGEGSRKVINGWVSDRTEGLIPDLLPEGFIQPNSVLILTDALYFKARWQTVFGKYGPVDGTFTTLDGSKVPTEFMQELELADRRGKGEGFVGAEIPYAGDQYSMLVIVPDEGRFEEVRDHLDQGVLDQVDRSFTTGPYELLLPKWEDNTQIDLLPWLKEIGAAPGSYPKITPLAFLDGAVHAADIAVDEWGTVAAAATGLGFADSGPPSPQLRVHADKPFLYLIRHRPTGLVMFAGQVTDIR